jgi:hypothetical protein
MPLNVAAISNAWNMEYSNWIQIFMAILRAGSVPAGGTFGNQYVTDLLSRDGQPEVCNMQCGVCILK